MAQTAVEVGVQNDYRYRGYSLADHHPVATVAVNHDDPSGVYLGGNLVGTFDDGEPELVAVQGTVGYAMRVSSELSVDAGVSHTKYGAYVLGSDVNYTELYLGLASRNVTARVRYSPDYYRNDWEALYVELDGGLEVAPDWFVSAHAGQLTYLGDIGPYVVRHTYDWRLGASRRLGTYGVHVELSGRFSRQPPASLDPGDDNPLRAAGTAIVFGVTRAF